MVNPVQAPLGTSGVSAVNGRKSRRLSRAEISWTATEAANEPWFNLVQRYAFAPYFVATLAGGSAQGASVWGFALGAGGLAIAILAPLLGAIADAGARLKPWLLFFTLMGIVAASSLWFAAPGTSLYRAALAVFVGTIATELMSQFCNAFLPRIAPVSRFGLLSGIAFGLSQIAGIAALLVIFAISRHPPAWLANVPHAADRMTGPVAAVAMILFLLPFLLLEKESGPTRRATVADGLRELRGTIREAWVTRPIRIFLIGRMFAADGMAVVFAFGAVLASASFGWGAGTLAVFGIAITVFGVIGGFLGSWLDSRLGTRRLVILGLAIVLLGTASVLMTDAARLFGFATGVPLGAPLSTPQEWGFVGSGAVVALGAAFAISAMRALMAMLAPEERSAAYFGLYALVGKATAFVGPTLVGLVAAATGSVRSGVVVALLFVGVGLAAMLMLKEGDSAR